MTTPSSGTSAEPPNDNDTLKQALTFVRDGNYEGAIGSLKTLLGTNPKHEIANGLLGSVYAELGMAERALECLEHVLAINPGNALARFQLGLLHLGAGRQRQALDAWKPALSDPNDFVAHYYSGTALLQLEETEKARPLLQEAARRMPKDHALYSRVQELLRNLTG